MLGDGKNATPPRSEIGYDKGIGKECGKWEGKNFEEHYVSPKPFSPVIFPYTFMFVYKCAPAPENGFLYSTKLRFQQIGVAG